MEPMHSRNAPGQRPRPCRQDCALTEAIADACWRLGGRWAGTPAAGSEDGTVADAEFPPIRKQSTRDRHLVGDG